MSTETKRHQLSKTVDLVIPPPRVRMHVDRLAMNREVESKLEPIRADLLALKKKGAPTILDKPDSKAEADIKDAYKASVKEFNSFASDDYTHNATIYELCKKLTKIVALFDKRDELASDGKTLSKKNQEELAKEQMAARDEPNSDDADPVTLGFTEYTKGVDLNHAAAVGSLLQKLRDENPQVDLFFQRDAVSKTKIRFTDSSIIALATTLQAGISEWAQHAMATTLELNKKIMYPDHCVSTGLQECSLYPLFSTLPSYMRIVERQQRREQWAADYKEWKAKNAKKKASKPKKAKKTTTAKVVEKPEFQSFEQREVENGFAFADEKVDGKGNTKITYLWKGIDDLEDVETDDEDVEEGGGRKFGFNFYIGQVCKNLKELNKKEDEEYEQVRVSTNIKRFFSNLLVELIHRIAPQIRLLMSYKDAKTVSYEMVVTVLKIILIDSYPPTPNGDVVLTEEHQALFDDMEKKVEAYNDYHKNAKSRSADDDEEVEVEDEVEEEEEAEPEPEPVPTKRGRNASRARTGKK